MSKPGILPALKPTNHDEPSMPCWASRFRLGERYRIWLAGWNLVVKITEPPRQTKGIHAEWVVKGAWEGTADDYEITEAVVNSARIDHLPA